MQTTTTTCTNIHINTSHTHTCYTCHLVQLDGQAINRRFVLPLVGLVVGMVVSSSIVCVYSIVCFVCVCACACVRVRVCVSACACVRVRASVLVPVYVCLL